MRGKCAIRQLQVEAGRIFFHIRQHTAFIQEILLTNFLINRLLMTEIFISRLSSCLRKPESICVRTKSFSSYK